MSAMSELHTELTLLGWTDEDIQEMTTRVAIDIAERQLTKEEYEQGEM